MRIHPITALIALTLVAAPGEGAPPPAPDAAVVDATAKDPDRRSRHDRDPAAALARLDTDHDRTLSAAELAAIRSQRYRERLLAFDRDHDQVLDDTEFAAASVPKVDAGRDG